jgi:hypothetical protein
MIICYLTIFVLSLIMFYTSESETIIYAIANIKVTDVPAAADPTLFSRRVKGKGVEVIFMVSFGLLSILRSKA